MLHIMLIYALLCQGRLTFTLMTSIMLKCCVLNRSRVFPENSAGVFKSEITAAERDCQQGASCGCLSARCARAGRFCLACMAVLLSGRCRCKLYTVWKVEKTRNFGNNVVTVTWSYSVP